MLSQILLAVLFGVGCATDTSPPVLAAVCAPDTRSKKTAGDANGDGLVDISDAAFLRDAVTAVGGPEPWCIPAVDATFDGLPQPDDVSLLLVHLFEGAFNLPNPSSIDCTGKSSPEATGCPLMGWGIAPDPDGGSARVLLAAPDLAVQGWSVSVAAQGCTVSAATTDGTAGASKYDDPAGKRDFGYAATLLPETGGATSAVLLGLVTPTTVAPGAAGTDVLRLTIAAGADCDCTLAIGDPLSALGEPVESVVAAGGRRYQPAPVSVTFNACRR